MQYIINAALTTFCFQLLSTDANGTKTATTNGPLVIRGLVTYTVILTAVSRTPSAPASVPLGASVTLYGSLDTSASFSVGTPSPGQFSVTKLVKQLDLGAVSQCAVTGPSWMGSVQVLAGQDNPVQTFGFDIPPTGQNSLRSDCAQIQDCFACTATEGCGWCASGSGSGSGPQCLPGDDFGPFVGICFQPTEAALIPYAWAATPGTCADPCRLSGARTCTDCALKAGCGWCEATCSCLKGSETSPEFFSCPATTSVPQPWSLSAQQCSVGGTCAAAGGPKALVAAAVLQTSQTFAILDGSASTPCATCYGVDCGPNGECVHTSDQAFCQCRAGYTGPRCEVPPSPCIGIASSQGVRTCALSGISSYTLLCADGRTGLDCAPPTPSPTSVNNPPPPSVSPSASRFPAQAPPRA